MRTFYRGIHKIFQNYFVMKSNPFLSGKATSCDKSKPKYPIAKCGEKKYIQGETLKAAFWKKLSLFGALPLVGVVSGIVFHSILNEPEKERPEFAKYEYLRIRNKRFPWGDGNKSLFHNPRVNALPDGYED